MTTLVTTLEQSERLKEWGAPQDTYLFHLPEAIHKQNGEVIHSHTIRIRGKIDISTYEAVAAYTLQELIEWIGDGFVSVSQDIFEGNKKGRWFAVCRNPTSGGRGHTSLEAVFNLCKDIKETE